MHIHMGKKGGGGGLRLYFKECNKREKTHEERDIPMK